MKLGKITEVIVHPALKQKVGPLLFIWKICTVRMKNVWFEKTHGDEDTFGEE